MENLESAVAHHYADARLLTKILAGLDAAGADPAHLRPDDLAPVDEFHLGGRKATVHAVSKLALRGTERVLDIGCGIGGAARYIATATGCRVTGIDLTAEYIDVAKTLTERTGLSGRVDFRVASALQMPFDDAAFDAALTLHVAMNIRQRAALYGEIARVMKPGATLCIYDVMKTNGDDIDFPVPWARTPDTSHLTTPDEMRGLLSDAGFELGDVEDRTDFALDFLRNGPAATTGGPPPLGVHLLLGADARDKIRNALVNIETGRVAPIQMIARRNAG